MRVVTNLLQPSKPESRKPIEQEFAECAERVKRLKNASSLEKNALIAICEGDTNEAKRLITVMEKRNTLNLKVI